MLFSLSLVLLSHPRFILYKRIVDLHRFILTKHLYVLLCLWDEGQKRPAQFLVTVYFEYMYEKSIIVVVHAHTHVNKCNLFGIIK